MLYQLSYASPPANPQFATPAWPPGKSLSGTEVRAGTLPLRAYHGTVTKISTAAEGEQTLPDL
jgi:hypothetical protein